MTVATPTLFTVLMLFVQPTVLASAVWQASKSAVNIDVPAENESSNLTDDELDSDDDNSVDEKKPAAVDKSLDAEQSIKEVLAGHSAHGEAFNEGPRQKAYLMGGTGDVAFPVTTESEEAQAFINQGIGQLHGFWYLEAERSFRQAAAIDPDCAMAYWGAAVATYQNRVRGRGFIDKAHGLKKNVTKREQMYIDAFKKYLAATKLEKKNAKSDDAQELAEKYKSSKDPEIPGRAKSLLKDLESISIDFPEDLEAKAFIAHRIWYNSREGVPITSYLSTDLMIKEVLRAEPLHPTHHYCIHLWDYRKPELALKSAARCGPSAPSIAHMWHMPGHIYSRLKRYEDAVFQQSASARVDHAHMMRDRVLPDQISNFAHNNEWLIRNLTYLGRATEAVELAKNMVELPRHPNYNHLEKRGSSAAHGRKRLLEVLRIFELHDQAVELCQSSYLAEEKIVTEKIKTLRLLGCSAAMTDQSSVAADARQQLEAMRVEQSARESKLENRIEALEPKKPSNEKSKDKKKNEASTDDDDSQQEKVDPASLKKSLKAIQSVISGVDRFVTSNLTKSNLTKTDNDSGKETLAEKDRSKTNDAELAELKKDKAAAKKLRKQLEKAILAIDGYQAAADGNFETAYKYIEKAAGEDVSLVAEWQFATGEKEKAIEKLKKQVDRRKQEVVPLARLAYVYHKNEDHDLAESTLKKLRDASSRLDLDIPMFARLAPIADRLELPADWRQKYQLPVDIGFRPDLDTLGPAHWSPQSAPTWMLQNASGDPVGSDDFESQPHIVIFYLGHGCLHCAEQLQAFAPQVDTFREAGIEMVAISTDDQAGLQKSIEDAGGEDFQIQLASNGDHDIFRAFRAYDDFEKQPLHGTFLIDAKGKIRWQDIGFEPFMDHEFLLKEARRLRVVNQ